MVDELLPNNEPESALPDIGREFLAQLKKLGERNRRGPIKTRGEKQLDARLGRLRDELNRNPEFFDAWISGLHEHAGDDENAQKNLAALRIRLDEKKKWKPQELKCLLGVETGDLPSLAGFSLMRLSHNYEEIYYADILSSILPKATIDFIKASVSVRRSENGWSGSVGVAVKSGVNQVEDSFSDPMGVVASEDLLGGNVSILMRSVYSHSSHYDDVHRRSQVPEDVIAVVFCFFPLPGVFEKGDLDLFKNIVDSRAYSIRAYCEHKDAHGNRQRLMKLMQRDHESASQQGMSEKDFLRTLVTPDTQNNPVGAVMGIYCDVEDRHALARSIAVCEGFIEQQSWFPDFLEETRHSSNTPTLSISFAKDNITWGEFKLLLRRPIELPAKFLNIPDAVTAPFDSLWSNLTARCTEKKTKQVSGVLSPHQKSLKIAGDMILALMGQILRLLALSLSPKDVVTQQHIRQITGNIQQILALARAYFQIPSEAWSSEQCIEALDDWVDNLSSIIGDNFVVLFGRSSNADRLPLDSHAINLWQSGMAFAEINSDNWNEWLGNLLQIDTVKLPVDDLLTTSSTLPTQSTQLDSLVRQLGIEKQLPVRLSVRTDENTQGVFLLGSTVPLVGYERTENRAFEYGQIDHSQCNPIISLVTSYYSSILLERDKAKADQDVILAQYARGASHGLKNALEVPQLVLTQPVQDSKSLLDLVDGSLSDEHFIKVQALTESSGFVLQEVKYLKQQAELFFWVMDPKKAQERIEERAETLEPTPFSQILEKAFLRGLCLTTEVRLSYKELSKALNKSSENEVESFIRTVHQSLVDVNADRFDDAIRRLKTTMDHRTCIDLTLPESNNGPMVKGITILLLDAVLMELSQNASKAAFLSAPDMLENNLRPYIKLEVVENSDRVIICISNSAKESDRTKLLSANELAHGESAGAFSKAGSGGIQGIWQVRMLCDQLSNELELCERPTLTQTGVSYMLTWRHG